MQRQNRTKTTKAAIAAYWLGSREGSRRFPENEARGNPGAPVCFACGSWATGGDEPPDLWTVWNKAALDRCHIRPRSLGGTDAPSNLVLLCSSCHREAPNVGDPRYMLKWMAARGTHFARWFEMLERVLQTYGLKEEYARIAAEDERGQVLIATVLDLRSTWIGTHGWYINESTEEAVIAEAVRRVSAGLGPVP